MPTYNQLKEHDRVMGELGLDYYGNNKKQNKMDERDVKAHNDAIQNERVGTYCRVCLQVVCMCNKFMDTKIHLKEHNRSVQDDKPRTKLSKEMQDFIVWVYRQDVFYYIREKDMWDSESYTSKSTLQLLIHFQKNIYKP